MSPRTQSSLACSRDGARWIIFNASPDIRQQIASVPELHPTRSRSVRNSPIVAVVLTNGDVDHIAGLLSLRERQPLNIYATSRVLSIIESNSVFGVLAPELVRRISLALETNVEIENGGGICVEAFPVQGKVALYLEDQSKGPAFGTEIGDTIGVKIHVPGSPSVFYIPGCADVDAGLLSKVDGAGFLFFDGTVFTDTELLEAGVGEKTGRRMGHLPISQEGGSLHAFDDVAIGRKIYVHINTTNPILERGSAAEKAVLEAGWEVAYDGMTLTL